VATIYTSISDKTVDVSAKTQHFTQQLRSSVCMKRQWVPSAIAGDRLEVQECDAAGRAGAQCDDSFHSPRVVTEVHVSVGNQVVVD
jgi:hypothetical protein